ncbi:MAG TPA: M23 family metallopeptidase [Calditerricola sp.]
MWFDRDRLKQRRRARMRQILLGGRFAPDDREHEAYEMREGLWPYSGRSEWDLPASSLDARRRGLLSTSRLRMQLILAAAVLVAGGLVREWPGARGDAARQFLRETLERDFNFQGVAAWYKAHIDALPAFLPVIGAGTPPASPAFRAPVAGKVHTAFSAANPGVWLAATPGAPVRAAAEGLVLFAGKQEGMGYAVVLRHPGGYVSRYANLGQVRVKKDDWVRAGDELGAVGGEGQAKGLLYFALQKDGQPVDPAGVMALE